MYILLLSWWAPLANCSAVQDLTLQSDGACAQSFRSAALARAIALYVLLLLLFWCWPFQPDSIHKLAFYLVWAAIYMAMIFGHIKIFWKLTWFFRNFLNFCSRDRRKTTSKKKVILSSMMNLYDNEDQVFCLVIWNMDWWSILGSGYLTILYCMQYEAPKPQPKKLWLWLLLMLFFSVLVRYTDFDWSSQIWNMMGVVNWCAPYCCSRYSELSGAESYSSTIAT